MTSTVVIVNNSLLLFQLCDERISPVFVTGDRSPVRGSPEEVRVQVDPHAKSGRGRKRALPDRLQRSQPKQSLRPAGIRIASTNLRC